MKSPLRKFLVALSVTFTTPAVSCEQSEIEFLIQSFNVDSWECSVVSDGEILICARFDTSHNTTIGHSLPLLEIGRVDVSDFSVTFECEIGACFKNVGLIGRNPNEIFRSEWTPSVLLNTSALSDLIKDSMVKCFANGGMGEPMDD